MKKEEEVTMSENNIENIESNLGVENTMVWDPSPPRKVARRELLTSPSAHSRLSGTTIGTNSSKKKYSIMKTMDSDGATDIVGDRSSITDEEVSSSLLEAYTEGPKQDSVRRRTTVRIEEMIFSAKGGINICRQPPPEIGVESTHAKQYLYHPSASPAHPGQYDFTWIESPETNSSNSKPNIRDSPRNIFDGKSLLRSSYSETDENNTMLQRAMLPQTAFEDSGCDFLSPCSSRISVATHHSDIVRFSMTPSPHKANNLGQYTQAEAPPDPHMSLVGLLWPSTVQSKIVQRNL